MEALRFPSGRCGTCSRPQLALDLRRGGGFPSAHAECLQFEVVRPWIPCPVLGGHGLPRPMPADSRTGTCATPALRHPALSLVVAESEEMASSSPVTQAGHS